MNGFFARKPLDIEEVRDAIGVHRRAGYRPIEILPIATVELGPGRYRDFTRHMLNEWEFLEPYVRQSAFAGENTARCVLLKTDGQPTIAVCLEGYAYPRYVALVLEDEPEQKQPVGV